MAFMQQRKRKERFPPCRENPNDCSGRRSRQPSQKGGDYQRRANWTEWREAYVCQIQCELTSTRRRSDDGAGVDGVCSPPNRGGGEGCNRSRQGKMLRRRAEGSERLCGGAGNDVSRHLDRRLPRQLLEVRPTWHLCQHRGARRQNGLAQAHLRRDRPPMRRRRRKEET